MARKYATPLAFKAAVEQKLRDDALALSMNLHRRRQLFIFDRYLARLFEVFQDAVVLKGGLVIELRLERARTHRRRKCRNHLWSIRDGRLSNIRASASPHLSRRTSTVAGRYSTDKHQIANSGCDWERIAWVTQGS